MPIDRQNTPPPAIGKIGRYTVFITPPATPRPQSERQSASSLDSQSSAERDLKETKIKVAPFAAAPIMSPPIMAEKKNAACRDGSGVIGMFWNAVARVQLAHSSVDDHLSRWFGLDQSKYQWALDDYYRSKGIANDDIKMKDVSSKV
ncbi:hypothetical protein QQ045_022512 [Rhodiola kirilowii]